MGDENDEEGRGKVDTQSKGGPRKGQAASIEQVSDVVACEAIARHRMGQHDKGRRS